MQATSDPEVSALLDLLLAELRETLGEQLVGLYLFGSIVTGDFDPAVSDVDLLAATSESVEPATLARLEKMHARVVERHPDWAGRVEVAYYSLAGLRTFKTVASPLAIISPGEPLHIVQAGRDWLMNWYVVRERGLTLWGPPPQAIIPPIEPAEYVAAVREYTLDWAGRICHTEQRRGALAYVVLTMCRSLYTMQHGVGVSKAQAARWAMGELPEWAGLIERALVWRLHQRIEWAADPAAYAETMEFVKYVTGQIRNGADT